MEQIEYYSDKLPPEAGESFDEQMHAIMTKALQRVINLHDNLHPSAAGAINQVYDVRVSGFRNERRETKFWSEAKTYSTGI